MSKLEEEFMDVLQNLEFALMQVYRANDDMTDWEAETAVSGLIRFYTAEQRKRTSPDLNLKPLEQEAYDRVKAMCELRLGRASLKSKKDKTVKFGTEQISLNDLILCLKRIRKSIQLWRKEGGRRGYFNFAEQFLP